MLAISRSNQFTHTYVRPPHGARSVCLGINNFTDRGTSFDALRTNAHFVPNLARWQLSDRSTLSLSGEMNRLILHACALSHPDQED